MSPLNQLSWENFRTTVLVRGQQRVHRVADSPRIEVYGDGGLNRIGIWLEFPSATPIPPELSKLAFITARVLKRDGRELLEIATAAPSLQRQFYHFAMAVAERVIVENRPSVDAVRLELQCFADLLEEKPLLGTERQLGLLGELLFLERLLIKSGLGALDSWVGPMGEPHDFRLAASEFEVKTTVSPRRIHTIHGMEQLVPSTGCSLYIVSVMLGPAGAGNGFSLSGKIAELSNQFAPESSRLTQFGDALETCGFRDADRGQYTRQFMMRRPMALVRVANNFPAITRSTVQTALGQLASRVESLQYDVDVDGLELEDGSAGFASVLPS